jgi:hypothetical protein
MTKGKEKCEQVWCTKCRIQGHHKDKFPTFTQYLEMGALNPLSRGGYCEICKKWGHHPTECTLLYKYQSTPRNLFCNFCKLVGHEEFFFRVFDLMRECTSDMCRIKEENVAEKGVVPQHNNKIGFNLGNRGNFGRGGGKANFGRGGRVSIVFYNCNQLGHLVRDCPNLCTTCTYYRSLDHAKEYCPQIVTKWKVIGNQNENPNQNVHKMSAEKRNEGPRITVVICGGAMTEDDMMNEGKYIEQRVRNSVRNMTTFDPQQEKETYQRAGKEVLG